MYVSNGRGRLVPNARRLKKLTDTLRVQKICKSSRILHIIQKCRKFVEEDNSENHRQTNLVIESHSNGRGRLLPNSCRLKKLTDTLRVQKNM